MKVTTTLLLVWVLLIQVDGNKLRRAKNESLGPKAEETKQMNVQITQRPQPKFKKEIKLKVIEGVMLEKHLDPTTLPENRISVISAQSQTEPTKNKHLTSEQMYQMLPEFVQVSQVEFEQMMPVERQLLVEQSKHEAYHACSDLQFEKALIDSEMNTSYNPMS